MSEFKIDTSKCIFALDGRDAENISGEFEAMRRAVPGLKMFICERLDKCLGMTMCHTSQRVETFTREEFWDLAANKEHYTFRTNDVIFVSDDPDVQSVVYTYCGEDLTGK